MQIETIKVLVKWSGTMEELENCEEILKDKKRELRVLSFKVASSAPRNHRLAKQDPLEQAQATAQWLMEAPQDVRDQYNKVVTDGKTIHTMLDEVQAMLEQVHKSMKQLIWNQ